MTATYDKHEVRKLDALPEEDKTEDIGLDIPSEVYEDLFYDEYPVVDMGWWFHAFYVYYDTEPDEPGTFDIDEEYDAWRYDDLRWQSWAEDDGTLVVNTDTLVGGLNHIEAEECDMPHAESLQPIYEAMEAAGVRLVIGDEDE
jgi:hypothetical protein